MTWAAQPLLLRKLRRRAVAEPGYGRAVGERFGRYARPIDSLMPPSSTDPLHSFVWIHAVSLGETRAAAILLAELRQQLPGMRLLLTHGTATGRAEGEKLLLPGDVQVWQPWDTRGAVRRFLRQFRPAIGILMETEVWPNLVAGCQQRGIPLVLANARFNATSLRKSQRLGALARPAYGGLTAVWAQTDADAERLQRMGAPVQGVFGNLKFDVVPDAAQRARGRAWRARSARPVVMLASSREGEEAMWLDVFKQNWHPALSQQASAAINSEANQGASPVQWLVVPRHPQRFAEVQQLLRSAGLTVSSRSQWADAPEPADVWLGRPPAGRCPWPDPGLHPAAPGRCAPDGHRHSGPAGHSCHALNRVAWGPNALRPVFWAILYPDNVTSGTRLCVDWARAVPQSHPNAASFLMAPPTLLQHPWTNTTSRRYLRLLPLPFWRAGPTTPKR
ncbi:MAG: 3-deoxy-D-manno-octulosonic acid transferase [Acidovorax sp. 17-64-282]|nr:MAG: 3-deoxy-D-manno-octulosonic acid transferase [Acidovorax sp. 17-64-282]